MREMQAMNMCTSASTFEICNSFRMRQHKDHYMPKELPRVAFHGHLYIILTKSLDV